MFLKPDYAQKITSSIAKMTDICVEKKWNHVLRLGILYAIKPFWRYQRQHSFGNVELPPWILWTLVLKWQTVDASIQQPHHGK